jgi:hypothetical protein
MKRNQKRTPLAGNSSQIALSAIDPVPKTALLQRSPLGFKKTTHAACQHAARKRACRPRSAQGRNLLRRREQNEDSAAILLPGGFAVTVINRLIGAEADCINPRPINAVAN